MKVPDLPSRIMDDIIALEDGYYYFMPSTSAGLQAHTLRTIADIIDEKNKAVAKMYEGLLEWPDPSGPHHRYFMYCEFKPKEHHESGNESQCGVPPHTDGHDYGQDRLGSGFFQMG